MTDYLSQKLKDKLRVVNRESSTYQIIGQKCYFCNTVITKRDATFPNDTFTSNQGHDVHGKCYDYVFEKYPGVPISELEHKIMRLKV